MPQFGYPNSDIENPGGWTTEPLWVLIDEEPFDDGDFLTSPKSAADKAFTVRLSGVTDPEVYTGHIVRIRAKTAVSGTFKYELMQGAVVIKDSGEVVLTTAFVEYNMTLSEGEAANITDYPALRVRVTAVVTKKNQRQSVSWIRFECPDAGGAIPKNVSDLGLGADSVGVNVRLSVSDSGAGADILAELKALLSVSESGSGVGAIQVGKSVLVSDVGVGAEVIAVLSKLILQDIGVGIDVIALMTALIGVLDSGAGADGVIVQVQGIQKKIQDSGVGQESVVIKALLSILDDALGSDFLTVGQSKTVLDVGEADEAVWDDAYITVQDSGLGSEALSILSKVKVQDVGLAAELLGILSKIGVQDLGIGIDEASGIPVSKRTVSDSGVGSESVSKEVIELIAYIVCLLEGKLEIEARLEKEELDIRAKLEEDLDMKGVLEK